MKKIISLLSFAVAMFLVACETNNSTTKVVMETSHGTMEFVLYNETPKHRDNFVELVQQQYFDSLLFHRVIKDFMIQAGDPDSKYAEPGVRLGEGGPGYRIDAEFKVPQLLHKRGALAAAREGDGVNPMKRSSASQFYIVWGKSYTQEELNSLSERMKELGMGEITQEQKEIYTTVGGTPFLDGQYTVFGEITKGFDVIDKIQNVETDANDRPIDNVRILSVKIID